VLDLLRGRLLLCESLSCPNLRRLLRLFRWLRGDGLGNLGRVREVQVGGLSRGTSLLHLRIGPRALPWLCQSSQLLRGVAIVFAPGTRARNQWRRFLSILSAVLFLCSPLGVVLIHISWSCLRLGHVLAQTCFLLLCDNSLALLIEKLLVGLRSLSLRIFESFLELFCGLFDIPVLLR